VLVHEGTDAPGEILGAVARLEIHQSLLIAVFGFTALRSAVGGIILDRAPRSGWHIRQLARGGRRCRVPQVTTNPEEAPALTDVSYDELEVGQVLGTVTEPVSAAMAGSLVGEIGAPGEAALAPPAVFPVLFLKALRRTLGGIPNGGVLAKYDLHFGAPLETPAEVEIEVSIADKYVRRERPYVVVQFAIDDADGERALTGLKTIMWPTGPGEG